MDNSNKLYVLAQNLKFYLKHKIKIDNSNKLYVLDRILNSEPSVYPWKYLIIKDFFPEDVYECVKSETSLYLERDEMRGTENRGVRAYHININKSAGVFPNSNQPFLSEYYNILLDKDIENAIKDKVNTKHHKNVEAVDMWSSFDIQTSGFVYDEVHSDHETKMISMIHYFAEPDDDQSLGTLLYSPDENGMTLSVENDIIARAPFFPNCAIFFAPCIEKGAITNHAMMHKSTITQFRKSIQVFWMREKANWTKSQSGRLELK